MSSRRDTEIEEHNRSPRFLYGSREKVLLLARTLADGLCKYGSGQISLVYLALLLTGSAFRTEAGSLRRTLEALKESCLALQGREKANGFANLAQTSAEGRCSSLKEEKTKKKKDVAPAS